MKLLNITSNKLVSNTGFVLFSSHLFVTARYKVEYSNKLWRLVKEFLFKLD